MKSTNFSKNAKLLQARGAPPVWAVRVKLPSGHFAIVTAWEPDERERVLLGAGDPLYVIAMGENMPILHLTTTAPDLRPPKPHIIKPGDKDFRFIPPRFLK